jgi:hypothetical protein
VIELASTVVVFGLVEIVLVLLAITIIAAMVSAFGHPALDNFRSRCPQSSAQARTSRQSSDVRASPPAPLVPMRRVWVIVPGRDRRHADDPVIAHSPNMSPA